MKNYFQMLAVAAGMVVATAPFSSCEKNGNNDDPDDNGNEEELVEGESTLPDSIKKGSDFYIIFMDETSADLGSKVKEPIMLRDYDVWPAGQSLVAGESLGINSWGAPAEYIPWVVASWDEGWNGGGIIAKLEEFETTPDLSPIMDGDFYFHFAIKSPSNQTGVGWTLFFNSEGPDVSYYFGPMNGKPENVLYGGNYPHDGEWHHFEIPVSELANEGYSWSEPLNDKGNFAEGRRYLLGYQNPSHTVGAELNLDAIFFYKKPAK
ncbi:MAG: hypothetical protein LBO71_08925 [Prevotellaceae bacterium]|nr:hypothetical protein [Prevotellaceae bacterium]